MKQLHLHLSDSNIDLEIALPASKSISNRALILNALSYSPYDVENLSDSDDTRVMLAAFDSHSNHFDIGAAGTSMRFMTAFLAKTVGEWTITGSERMKQRPIKILVDALNKLGGKIEYLEKEGFPPLKIYGSAMMGGDIELDGSVSSQYISALMMIAPYMVNGLTISLQGEVISRPYIEMTQQMMKDFGVHADFSERNITIKPQTYRPVQYRVESDWSAAAYWYEILSIAGKGKLKLLGLQKKSMQGDSQLAKIYKELGVATEFVSDGVILSTLERKASQRFEYNFINQPDLAQSVVVNCCMLNQQFHFTGLQSLKIKETNRVAALIAELKKLGYVLHEPAEGELAWSGEKCAEADMPEISTYEDHRMAMAFAPVALIRPLVILNPEVVSKSYPTFWDDLKLISQ